LNMVLSTDDYCLDYQLAAGHTESQIALLSRGS
jgi:hypothetical protein